MTQRRFLFAVLISGLILTFGGFALMNAGRFLAAPAEAHERADAIVILGGGWVERIVSGHENIDLFLPLISFLCCR